MDGEDSMRVLQPGDYVVVQVRAQGLTGTDSSTKPSYQCMYIDHVFQSTCFLIEYSGIGHCMFTKRGFNALLKSTSRVSDHETVDQTWTWQNKLSVAAII